MKTKSQRILLGMIAFALAMGNMERAKADVIFSISPDCAGVGEMVTITADHTFGGQLYRCFVQPPGETFQMIQDRTMVKTINWTPGQSGIHIVVVQVTDNINDPAPLRQMGGTYDVGGTECPHPVQVTLSPANGAVNETVTITAMTEGSNLMYRFFVRSGDFRPPSQPGPFMPMGDWTANNTFEFTPDTADVFTLIVQVTSDPINPGSEPTPKPQVGVVYVVGRIDDFEDGTFQGWSGGADHANISTGGPAGAGDNYLEISRTASAFHIGTKNTTTWAGDYLALGVKAIEMDVNSIGPADLSLRIMLIGPGGNFSTATAIPITTGGGWQHIVFGLTPSDLVHVTGSVAPNAPDGLGILNDTLADVGTLLIRHDPAPAPKPPGTHPQHVLATLGIDNITAVLGLPPSNDVAWTFDNLITQSYIVGFLNKTVNSSPSTRKQEAVANQSLSDFFQNFHRVTSGTAPLIPTIRN